jgi:hypothetical protein
MEEKGEDAMSDETRNNKPQRDSPQDDAGASTTNGAGASGRNADAEAMHRYSVQGLIAIIQEKSYCSAVSPPHTDPQTDNHQATHDATKQ